MITRDIILGYIPHQGLSCLLDTATKWDDTQLEATTRRHNDPANPYRMAGSLPPVVGIEMAMQAAALHGAMTTNNARQGWLANARNIQIHCDRLDLPEWESLIIMVRREHYASNGMIYSFTLQTPSAHLLMSGTGAVILA